MLLKTISYKHRITNEEVRRKVIPAVGDYDEQEMETKVVWPPLKVFWFSEDDSAGHCEKKKKKRGRKKKRWGDNIKEQTGWTLQGQLGQLKTQQDKGFLRSHL